MGVGPVCLTLLSTGLSEWERGPRRAEPSPIKDYLFIFREREGERGRETSMCGFLSYTPHWGPGLQPRHVP